MAKIFLPITGATRNGSKGDLLGSSSSGGGEGGAALRPIRAAREDGTLGYRARMDFSFGPRRQCLRPRVGAAPKEPGGRLRDWLLHSGRWTPGGAEGAAAGDAAAGEASGALGGPVVLGMHPPGCWDRIVEVPLPLLALADRDVCFLKPEPSDPDTRKCVRVL